MSFHPRLHFLGGADASIPSRLVPGCEWGVGGAWSGTGPSKPPFILQPFIPLRGVLIFFQPWLGTRLKSLLIQLQWAEAAHLKLLLED